MTGQTRSTPQERRNAPRVVMDIEAEAIGFEPTPNGGVRPRAPKRVTLLNLGPDGAFLRLVGAHRFEVGRLLQLRFRIDSLPLPLVVQAVVRWVRESETDGALPPGVGVQFHALVEYERSALADYCHRRLEDWRLVNRSAGD